MRSRRGVAAVMLAAVLVYAGATLWVERPWLLSADAVPHGDAMADADLYLNVWILAWTAHAAVHSPMHLFDGNVFYPARHALLGSENMLAHLPITVPVLAAAGTALRVLQAVVLESFVLCGVAMMSFVWWHTRDACAALAAGAIYAFTDVRAHAVSQPQYLGTQYVPLALLAIDCWLLAERRRALAGLAAALAMQALACVYIGYFAFLTLPVYGLARSLQRSRRSWPRATLHVAIAFVAAGVVLAPVALLYARAQHQGVIPEYTLQPLAAFSQPPQGWLTTVAMRFTGTLPYVVLPLDVILRWRRRIALAPVERALWIFALWAAVLAMGPSLELPLGRVPLPYLLAYHLVPGFSAIRAPVRLVFVVAAALSALTGFALARWLGGRARAVRVAVALAAVAFCAFRAAPDPVAVAPIRLGADLPPVYDWLARQPHVGGVVELPCGLVQSEIGGNWLNGRYMVASTAHWQSLVNGYTAYAPPTAPLLTALMRRLPDPDALQTLVDLVDVRWVIVHYADMSPNQAAAWSSPPTGFRSITRFGNDEVFEVILTPRHDWRAALLERAEEPSPPTTLGGVSRAPLAPGCHAARILTIAMPAVTFRLPGLAAVPIRFANDGDCGWPGLDVDDDGLVGLRFHWRSERGNTPEQSVFTRLARDVPPHTTVADTMVFWVPGEPGRWTWEVELIQRGVDEPLATATATTDVLALHDP